MSKGCHHSDTEAAKQGKDASHADMLLQPIHLPSSTSKVLERLVQRRVQNHLRNFDLVVVVVTVLVVININIIIIFTFLSSIITGYSVLELSLIHI